MVIHQIDHIFSGVVRGMPLRTDILAYVLVTYV
jgi:hypothetical protein